MPKGIKRKEKTITTETTSTNRDLSTEASSESPVGEKIVGPLSSVEKSQGDEPEAAARIQFRSWVTDKQSGYSRMTDEINRRLVLQFSQKPTADTLATLKSSGFQFKPEYYGQRNVWVRANDFEGRLRAEAIEKQLSESLQQTAMVPF